MPGPRYLFRTYLMVCFFNRLEGDGLMMRFRKRIPAKDDRAITALVRKTLLPYAKIAKPSLSVSLKEMKERLAVGVTWVLTENGRLQGFIHVKPEQNVLLVSLLAVKPSSQGKGLGSRLMRRAEKYASDQGYQGICLFADRSNSKAIRFYKLKGYRIQEYISEIDNYMMWKETV
ncbi:GNAT family N-acetyltransferase [Marinicrinis lubricantis]